MKYVYICHPLSGDIEGNIEKVKDIVRSVCTEEIVAFAPHLAFAPVFNDNIPEERERGISTDLALLRSGKIDELWIYGEKLSEGMKFEVEVCIEHNIPIQVKSPILKTAVKNHVVSLAPLSTPRTKQGTPLAIASIVKA